MRNKPVEEDAQNDKGYAEAVRNLEKIHRTLAAQGTVANA
jgi:uncharacterized Zn finger protein